MDYAEASSDEDRQMSESSGLEGMERQAEGQDWEKMEYSQQLDEGSMEQEQASELGRELKDHHAEEEV